jgi:hypothetical protein
MHQGGEIPVLWIGARAGILDLGEVGEVQSSSLGRLVEGSGSFSQEHSGVCSQAGRTNVQNLAPMSRFAVNSFAEGMERTRGLLNLVLVLYPDAAVSLYVYTYPDTLLAFSNWPDRELAPRIRKDIR